MFYEFTTNKGDKSIAQILKKKHKEEQDKNGTIKKKKDKKLYEPEYLDLKKIEKKEGSNRLVSLEDTKKTFLPLMLRQGTKEEPMPNKVFLAGAGLSGKSYLARKLAEDYALQYPDNKIVLISWVENDKNLNEKTLGKNFIRLNIDENILADPIDIKDFHDKLIIMDDIEHFENPYIVKELMRVRNSIVNAGRHNNTDLLCCRQVLMDSKNTRDLLNGVPNIIVFPHSSSRYQLKNYLLKYMMLDSNTVNKLMNVNSRWLLLSNTMPLYALWENGAMLL